MYFNGSYKQKTAIEAKKVPVLKVEKLIFRLKKASKGNQHFQHSIGYIM